jgi:hypothetical protein
MINKVIGVDLVLEYLIGRIADVKSKYKTIADMTINKSQLPLN